jgi:hypothetical protein
LQDSGCKSQQIEFLQQGIGDLVTLWYYFGNRQGKDPDGSTMKNVDIFVLAGIWTAPNFMEALCMELIRRYENEGWSAEGKLLFPYGDWYLGRMRQLREITLDMLPKASRLGGRKAADEIKKFYRGGKMVIVGHSGGGVAGVHAAQILLSEAEDLLPPSVVQIGSPKCSIPPVLREHVIYVAAVDKYGKWKDPITRLGGWGWRGRTSRMRSNQTSPAIREIPIVGGHADYFRTHNIDVTIDSFWRDIR